MSDSILDLEQAMVAARQASDAAASTAADDAASRDAAIAKADASAQAAVDAKAAHMASFVALGDAIKAENSPAPAPEPAAAVAEVADSTPAAVPTDTAAT